MSRKAMDGRSDRSRGIHSIPGDAPLRASCALAAYTPSLEIKKCAVVKSRRRIGQDGTKGGTRTLTAFATTTSR